MRYAASEKLEIIRLVEQSHLPVRKTLTRRLTGNILQMVRSLPD